MMTPTAAQRASRNAANARWRARNPGYHRAWRAAHPGYQLAWQAANPVLVARARGRALVILRARAARYAPIPRLHDGHPLFARARLLVPDGAPMTMYAGEREQARDEARSEAVLAMLEGRDPAEAVRRSRSRDAEWRAMTREPVVEF